MDAPPIQYARTDDGVNIARGGWRLLSAWKRR
jgi:hypothetical protein